MTIKKAHTITRFNDSAAPLLEENVQRLYVNKVESRFRRDSATVSQFSYQSIEHGLFSVSAAGVSSITTTLPLAETHNTIIWAVAHARSAGITAHVTDVTNTSISVTVTSPAATLSAVTTSSFIVQYQVIGSSP